MQVIDFIAAYGPWAWIVAGLILLALELVVPGGFLVWMGVAGLVTGGIAMVQPIGWPLQWLIFGVLSLVAITLWIRWQRGRKRQNDRPFLNHRADRFTGQVCVLDDAIVDGFGRLVLDDTVWRVSGPNLPAGARVRITGNNGAVLHVEAV